MSHEIPLVFECAGDSLVGIVTVPEAAPEVGLLIIVGGPQYRAGSHRQFVQLARHVATKGFAAMRFDARGMGDASGVQRPFEDTEDDVAAAIDALQRAVPSVKQVGLWGLCGGASAALLYCLKKPDPRVAGLALINPWVRSEQTEARTRVKHYYTRRLTEAEFWKKLVSGHVALSAARELLSALRIAAVWARPRRSTSSPLAERMVQALASFTGDTVIVLSENDYTAKEFLETVHLSEAWKMELARDRVNKIEIAGADHTFSQPELQRKLEMLTTEWLGAFHACTKALAHEQGHRASPLETKDRP